MEEARSAVHTSNSSALAASSPLRASAPRLPNPGRRRRLGVGAGITSGRDAVGGFTLPLHFTYAMDCWPRCETVAGSVVRCYFKVTGSDS